MKGTMTKVKHEIGWGRNAQETLIMHEEAQRQWGEMKIRGADEIQVGARKEFTTSYFVQQGTLMRWSFRVKVGFVTEKC